MGAGHRSRNHHRRLSQMAREARYCGEELKSCLTRLYPYPALVSPQRPRETPEPGRANMLGADLRRPRRRLSTGPGLGWAEPEPLDPGVPLPHRPTTLPLLIPPRISITKADR